MDEDEFLHFFVGLVIGMIIEMILIFAVISIGNNTDGNNTEELGQAICEEKFDMDFKSYDNKELKCKDKEVIYEGRYDGITLQIES